jgi:hypothetical protein
VIQIGKTKFNFTKSQLPFLSLKALQHFESTHQPFIINDSNSQLISSFRSLASLLIDQAELNITEENVNSLKLLSEQLDNKSLLSKCELFSSNQPETFTLNSKHFLTIPQHQIEFINDFIFIISNKRININHSLLCCISNKFKEMKEQKNHFTNIICLPFSYFY